MNLSRILLFVALAAPAQAAGVGSHAEAQACLGVLSLAMGVDGLDRPEVAQAHHSLTLLLPTLTQPDFAGKVAERNAAAAARRAREEALAKSSGAERQTLLSALEVDIAACLVPATTGTDLPAPIAADQG